MKNFSIVIPFYNEDLNIDFVINEIIDQLKIKNHNFFFEIIAVNDCSNDDTKIKLLELSKKIKNLKIVTNSKNMGQSFSILNGVKIAQYNTIVTLDGDGQNNPKDIKKVLEKFFSNDKISLVGGIRQKRKDNIIKIISSKIANNIRIFFLKDNCIDTGCALKVFNKDIFLKLNHFNGIHRFLPALFMHYGDVEFVSVDHRYRLNGVSKYGTVERMIKGILDIIKVKKMISNIKNDR